MNDFRAELRRAVGQRFKRVDLDRFKQELKEHITHFLFERTQRSPIIIPVINIIGGKNGEKPANGNQSKPKDPAQQTEDLQRRYAMMRQRLLNQDARVD